MSDLARAIQDGSLFVLYGITFSVGLSVNKVMAKVASKWNKPFGLTVIPKSDQGFPEGIACRQDLGHRFGHDRLSAQARHHECIGVGGEEPRMGGGTLRSAIGGDL
jgi:hypothetical protein